MMEYIKKIYNNENFGFYLRKAIFQGFLPILLGMLSFFDFLKQTSGQGIGSAYKHMYFYTTVILLIYTQIKIVLEFIFSICTENVIFRKEISLEKSMTEEVLMPIEEPMNSRDHFIITIKRIFKLRYSNSTYFKFICNFCWIIGMECPLLIPFDIIAKLANAKDSITRENEQ